MAFARLLVKIIDLISEWSGRIASFIAFPMMGVIAFEVIARYVFHRPTLWASDLAQMFLGAYIILGGAFTLLHKGHVSMDILYIKLTPRKRAVVDLFTSILLFIFCGVFLWQGTKYGLASLSALETSSNRAWPVPIWPVKMLIPIGALFIFLQGLSKFTRDFVMALTGKELE